MKQLKWVLVVCAVFLVSVSGCKKNEVTSPAPAPHAQPMAATPQGDDSLSGKVVETMNAAGYTYVSLENNGKKTWVAIPQTAVQVGQNVTCQPGSEMRNFRSKTLNRTFESIYFSAGIR